MTNKHESEESVESLQEYVEIWLRYHDRRRLFFVRSYVLFQILNIAIPIIIFGVSESPELVLVSAASLVLINLFQIIRTDNIRTFFNGGWYGRYAKHDEAYKKLICISDNLEYFHVGDKGKVRQKVYKINEPFHIIHENTFRQAKGDCLQANKYCLLS